MFNLNLFGIDEVQLKSQIQRLLFLLILLIVLWNPLYTLLLLGAGFVARKNKRYKRYYMMFLVLAIVVYAGLIGYYPMETFIMESLQDYLLPLPPARMITSLCLTLAVTYFDFGSVDSWMIQEEKQRQKQIFSEKEELSFENRSHIFCAGTTGAGKTTLLIKFIYSSLRNNEPIYIISGKRSGDKGSLLEFVKKLAKVYKRKLYIVSMNEKEKERVSYNPFKDWQIIEIADALCNASEFTEPHYQQNLSCWIKVICECMKIAGIEFSLRSIVDFMVFENFRALIQDLLKKKKIIEEAAINYLDYEDIAKIAASSRARFLNILLGEGKEVIGGKNGISATDVHKENAILFVDLDSFSYTDYTKIIGAFFINDMRHIVVNSTEAGNKRIVMDELATYVTKQIMPLFSQSRSYGYQLIVATQSIADLDEISPVFSERLMENCGQYGILQLNSAEDAERISKIIGTTISIETTRKSTGMHLHYSADGSKKVVNAFKIPPDMIKELQALQVLFYDKKEPEKVKKIELKYGLEGLIG